MSLTVKYLKTFPHAGGVTVDFEHRWIWLKPCRTAGTSILYSLPKGSWINGGPGQQPDQVTEWLNSITDEELQDYTVIANSRNPYDRFVSACAYLHLPLALIKHDLLPFVTPNVRDHLLPLYWYTRYADYVIRFEHLQNDYDALANEIEPFPQRELPNRAESEHPPYMDVLDDPLITLVNCLYHHDFHTLNYTTLTTT